MDWGEWELRTESLWVFGLGDIGEMGSKVILEVLLLSCVEGDIFSQDGGPLEEEQMQAHVRSSVWGVWNLRCSWTRRPGRNYMLESGCNLVEDEHLRVSDTL